MGTPKETKETKEIKAIKIVRKTEREMWNKAVLCKQHNLPLEEMKYRHTEEVCRKLSNELQNIFDTGYVSIGD